MSKKDMNKIQKIKSSIQNDLNWYDWLFFGIVIGVCYLSFIQNDLLVTANRSFLYYGHFKDFYQASSQWTGDYGANYLPSTFVVFAIWNLPLYLLGRIPEHILSNVIINTMWYKLLPTLVYFICGLLMKKIAEQLGFEGKKAKLCMYVFWTCPIAVFSQFIFSQYDIFTVVFILLGFYHWQKKNDRRFVLFFAIAITFKYHALLYFVILLLLRQKNVLKLIRDIVLVLIPMMIEIAFYWHDPYFRKSVFGFSMLDNAKNSFSIGFFRPLSLVLIVSILLCVVAYLKECKEESTEIQWSLFLCGGCSFALFGCMQWNPQWLIIMVPFLTLTALYTDKWKVYLLIETIFSVCYFWFIVNNWKGNVDEYMLGNGVFKHWMSGKAFALSMSDIFPEIDPMYLVTCMWTILLLFFVLAFPKFHLKMKNEISDCLVGYVKLLFCVGCFSFLIPASMCLVNILSGHTMFYNVSQNNVVEAVPIDENNTVSQCFQAKGEKVEHIRIYLGTYNRINESVLDVTISNEKTKEVVYQDSIELRNIVNDNTFQEILKDEIVTKKDDYYVIELSSTADENECVAAYCTVSNNTGDTKEQLETNDGKLKGQLVLKIEGKQML